jgi:putative polyhydroxyalkanoate system protein
MPKIDIRREHGKGSIEEVRADVEDLAGKLRDKFNLEYRWKGNDLVFKRTGVEGRIEVDARSVRLVMSLSMLLAPIKGEVERRTLRYMDEYFKT